METELYEDYGEEIPNEATLHAIAQADRILDAWEKMKEEEWRLARQEEAASRKAG